MAVQTLSAFIKAKYDANPRMKQYYGSFLAYRRNYIDMNGISDWLETLRDQELTRSFVDRSLGRTFILEWKREPHELPGVLVAIARQYNVELPCVEGILTEEYWELKAAQMGWGAKNNEQAKAA
jgi:hypothetical protein